MASAMCMSNNVLNETPSLQDKQRQTPQQISSKTKTNVNPKHWKTFGCPVHVLNADLSVTLAHGTNDKNSKLKC